MTSYTTGCPRNCYSTCTFKVHVDEGSGRIKKIDPYPSNKATPEGPCLKGLSYVERVHSPDRILQPMIKREGSSDFEEATWEKVLDRIAERLRYYRDAFGPRSVFFYTGIVGIILHIHSIHS